MKGESANNVNWMDGFALRSTQSLTEINFLCIHKKLRSKRLAPVLIKEITRRSHLEGIFQAVYTAGVVLPKPVATCRWGYLTISPFFCIADDLYYMFRYYHRSLNPKKLVECNFSRIPPKWTLARMIKHYKVPEQTSTPGLRVMKREDVPQVRKLLNTYLSRFDIAPVFETDADVEHWILPHEDVVWSYVVEASHVTIFVDYAQYWYDTPPLGSRKSQYHWHILILLATKLSHWKSQVFDPERCIHVLLCGDYSWRSQGSNGRRKQVYQETPDWTGPWRSDSCKEGLFTTEVWFCYINYSSYTQNNLGWFRCRQCTRSDG